MSTSANAPGDPGRDRDDAGDPAADPSQDADGAAGQEGGAGGTDAEGAEAAGAAKDSGAASSKESSDGTGQGGAAAPRRERSSAQGSGGPKDSGRDVTKKVRGEARTSQAAVKSKPKKRSEDEPGLFGRIALFVRQVIAEIRKVVQPTRNELVTFSVVVIVFILAMMAYVGVLDFAIGRLVLWVFGD